MDVVGLNAFNPEYRRDLKTYIFYSLYIIGIVAEIYSILYYDLFMKLIALIDCLLALQVLVLLCCHFIVCVGVCVEFGHCLLT